MTVVLKSLVPLFVGGIIGFLAQRSRMCFIAGVRDFILVRDRELLNGFLAFLITVWILTSILSGAGLLQQGVPEFDTYHGTVRPIPLKQHQPDYETAPVILGSGQNSVPVERAVNRFFFLSAAGGFILGLVSVLSGGCVMRQHVLSAQGNGDASYFLIGFYAGVPAYYFIFQRYLTWVYG